MTEQESNELIDGQRALFEKRGTYLDAVREAVGRGYLDEALEAERMAGDCLVAILGIAETVGSAQWEELQAVKAERDTLAAELVALRAWLPRWQRHGELWLLIAGTHRVWVEPVGDKWRPMHFGPETYSLEDAMVVAGGYLGLPPCEVEGE